MNVRTCFLLAVFFGQTLSARSQETSFDYRIKEVVVYEVIPSTGEKKVVTDLQPYLYDIGPMPHFQFEVRIAQLTGKSPGASHVNLKIERYMLLQANEEKIYEGLENLYPDISPSPVWTYHGPVELEYTRKRAKNNTVLFSTATQQFKFLDPANPITFAHPLAYSILGYAYRFALVPSSIHMQDKNPADNTFQVTFLKP